MGQEFQGPGDAVFGQFKPACLDRLLELLEFPFSIQLQTIDRAVVQQLAELVGRQELVTGLNQVVRT